LHRATDKPEGGVDRWTPRRREARHIAGSAWSTKRYLNIELLKDQQMKGVHHRVSQGRVPLSQTESAKDSGLYARMHLAGFCVNGVGSARSKWGI
jgi:hypothetical protein